MILDLRKVEDPRLWLKDVRGEWWRALHFRRAHCPECNAIPRHGRMLLLPRSLDWSQIGLAIFLFIVLESDGNHEECTIPDF